MLLWATEARAAPQHGNTLLWQGAARQPGVRSLAEYIDAHAEEIRRRYLRWSFDFGELQVFGRKLRECFMFAHGASFWWYSLFVEQSAWKQRSLETLLRVFALEHLLERESPRELTLVSANRDLNRVLQRICRRHGIRYSWSRVRRQRVVSPRNLLRALPRSVQGLMALAHFAAVRLALGGRRAPAPASAVGRVLICGAFANHNARRDGERDFTSRFWGTLPEVLQRDGYHVQWLHLFYAHDQVPNAREARKIVQRLNASSPRAGLHSFVESYLPTRDLARVFGRWLAIAAESLVVGLCLARRFARGNCEIYWPLLRDDWAKAFRGFDCVQTLFYAACFDRALRGSQKFDECLYLMENQGWERALARAWHQHGRGRLTGAAHSTVRFWDLRYHCDPRRYERPYRDQLPAPDWVALNGRAAREAYVATCAAREPLADCEALRYLHLTPGEPRDLSELRRGAPLRILLLGDYTPERTEALLRVAERLRGRAGSPLEVLVKPHPGCPIDPRRCGDSLRVVNDPVAGLVASAHLVLASNTTSAALEAYVSGGRLLVLDDRSGVNYSPLRNVPGVSFVSDADDVCSVIEALDPGAREQQRQTDGFFNIDPTLPGWRRFFDVRRRRGHAGATAPGPL
jgi:surface carbohydrate biosynthesis protein (TIGR04326 family)